MKKIVVFCILVFFIPVFAFAQLAYTLDAALSNAIFYLNGTIQPGSKVAVLNFTSKWPELTDYVIEELTGYIVNDKALTVVDRANLETIRREMDFQLSGEVSDETAQSIGKKLGAQVIISGAMSMVGSSYRLRIKAISVETAQILGMQNVDVAQDHRIASLTGTAYAAAALPVAANVNTKASGNLTLWSFTTELGDMLKSKKFKPPYKKAVTYRYSEIPWGQFDQTIDPVLFSGRGTPDIITIENSVIRKYVESGFLMDLTDIYEANKEKLLRYPVEIGSYNGRVYALSWQAAPGAMYYRRSLAKKYLGTDDPNVVQNYFINMNKFLETAQLLKDKSGGKCIVVSGHGELLIPYLSNRKSPWVVNRQLVIDPMVEQYMDVCLTLINNRYALFDGYPWGEGWTAGMKGEQKDWEGNPVETFAYFLPSWGLQYTLKNNAPKTSGDWAMIPGPLPFYTGGAYIAAWRDTPNPIAAKELIRYIITDDKFLEAWVKFSGDLVTNLNVVNKISKNFKDPFLGKQNYYRELAELAKRVDGRLLTVYDSEIYDLFGEELQAFMYEGKSKQQALADFRAKVEYNLLRGQ